MQIIKNVFFLFLSYLVFFYWITIRKLLGFITIPLLQLFKKLPKKSKKELDKIWKEKLELDIYDFNDEVNKYPYRYEPLKGAIDFTIPHPAYFFDKDLKYRDCDDFAEVWYRYFKDNGYPVYKIVMFDPKSISKAHVFTVYGIQINNEIIYKIADFRLRPNKSKDVHDLVNKYIEQKINNEEVSKNTFGVIVESANDDY